MTWTRSFQPLSSLDRRLIVRRCDAIYCTFLGPILGLPHQRARQPGVFYSIHLPHCLVARAGYLTLIAIHLFYVRERYRRYIHGYNYVRTRFATLTNLAPIYNTAPFHCARSTHWLMIVRVQLRSPTDNLISMKKGLNQAILCTM